MLDRFRHGGVQHKADVGAVDAHAERHGGDDDIAAAPRRTHPALAALFGFQARRDRARRCNALGLQHRRKSRPHLAADAINDARLACMAPKDFEHLLAQRRAAAARGKSDWADRSCRPARAGLVRPAAQQCLREPARVAVAV